MSSLEAFLSTHSNFETITAQAGDLKIIEKIAKAVGQDVVEKWLKTPEVQPAIEYLLDVIIAQRNPATITPPASLIATLALVLSQLGHSSSTQSATAIFDSLKADGLIAEVSTDREVNRLADAVVMDKLVQRSMKDIKLGGLPTADDETVQHRGQYNEMIDWDRDRARAKADRKRKRDTAKRDAIMGEYEHFLAARGISKENDRQVVKIHSSGEWRADLSIKCEGICVSMGTTRLLVDADLIIQPGRRYGMVGRNGVGKTTLLRHLSEGELEGVSPFLQILHIEQEIAGSDTKSALDVVLESDVERTRLLAQVDETLANDPDSAELGALYTRLDEIDAYSAPSRASAILSGLSFDEEMMRRPTKLFSGGWRMRIALARALFVAPDVLLLDEPTNHLDLHAVLWLEATLRAWPGTLIIVSHSRSFLNNVCTDIIHYHNHKLTYYRGDYNQFEKARVESLQSQAKIHEAQQKQREHTQAFIDRFRFNAKRAAMVQSRIKALDRLEFVAAVAEDPTFSFSFPSVDALPPPVLQGVEVSFNFPSQRPLFTNVDFYVDCDSRIVLVGPNGSGKTTFLSVLLGILEATSGRVERNGKARIGYFSQHHIDSLALHMSSLEFLKHKFPRATDQELRSQLSRFGLPTERHEQKIYTLSGGQKSRIAFAAMSFTRPHVLLLDEPTNHLDLDTVDALIQSLHEFEGGVVLISHDEHLISSLNAEVWCATGKGGTVSKWPGDFASYRRSLDMAKITKGAAAIQV